ncbi:MAG TPA: alpha/beta fold hydrolase, partial [Streptosporangiaceae bacterium]
WLRPGLRFVNDYGPTETTVTATVMELDATTPLPPPIGRPIAGWRAYVLDAHLNPVPVGVTGELHIGGHGVARGYLNRPELTRERFISDPFVPGERLYKTGDLVRRRPDGTIVFTGRVDGQVKIRGLRIELGEIETTLTAHPAVAQAVVVAVTDPSSGERQLAAYLRARPGARADPADVRAHLARTLPAYMLPAHLVSVTEFPLSTTGKIDRAALPPPPDGREPAADREPAPGTETTIARLFGAVLCRERVSATTSFFHAGGSSLQAMRLVDLISAELGADIDATAIFTSPTPRELAATVDAAARRPGPLVELARGPAERPLFLIHAVGGTVFAYARLAQELAGTFGVYGLQAPGLAEPGSTAPSLAGLVADYTRRIAEFQPAGPYRLAGWSMGGVIAFEVARRLELAGADVGMLLLLDAPFAIPGGGQPTEPAIAAQFAADVVVSLGLDAAGLPSPATSAAGQLSWLADRIGASDQPGAMADGEQLRLRFEVFRAHTEMLAGYRPAGPAVAAPALVVSAGRSPNAQARARWPEVLGGPVRVLTMNADHYSFLRPPAVGRVATWIRRQHDELAAAVARPAGPGSVAQVSAERVSR